MTNSFTKTTTFTITHARYLSSKVAADMHICAQYYGYPSEATIRDFAEELAQYISEGYVKEYEFGYQKNNKRVVTWRYKVDQNGLISTDDRSGKIVPYVDIQGASFFNHLTQSRRFFQLSAAQQARFRSSLPVQRTNGEPPSDGSGYWTSDRNYYSGGQSVARQTFQPATS
jgi:hypothetical protein